ncbi:hypothetical protein [Streptomyces clavuligerus]|uniref:Secreted protein n=1 Tax=Streptomyces clavuligerus TaxID=1901 RepID=E2PXL7_STRCL|nr:hypothetical protein [Streptomyces clavuligerus]ANW20820.1 hypothetical protein BB341_22705 [Streptomyces clavuligerus]AXU15446.1 hypothetical protein D1794_23605 [Streptomyces clavuligerus]EFG06139.1 secreted protein [Streptomyces clavuligerus]MBY6305540.1 hypothetical protein [Streptomyces clavuligerus]QCS08222.1 hypothetical protein CRV15_22970 [Streptomyces clavuligerus]
MNIDWVALGSVFGVSLLATVTIAGLFVLGLVGLSKQEIASAQGGSAVLARTSAYLCFALCAVAVSFGIYLIVT